MVDKIEQIKTRCRTCGYKTAKTFCWDCERWLAKEKFRKQGIRKHRQFTRYCRTCIRRRRYPIVIKLYNISSDDDEEEEQVEKEAKAKSLVIDFD
jgi:hypothetical protein